MEESKYAAICIAFVKFVIFSKIVFVSIFKVEKKNEWEKMYERSK